MRRLCWYGAAAALAATATIFWTAHAAQSPDSFLVRHACYLASGGKTSATASCSAPADTCRERVPAEPRVLSLSSFTDLMTATTPGPIGAGECQVEGLQEGCCQEVPPAVINLFAPEESPGKCGAGHCRSVEPGEIAAAAEPFDWGPMPRCGEAEDASPRMMPYTADTDPTRSLDEFWKGVFRSGSLPSGEEESEASPKGAFQSGGREVNSKEIDGDRLDFPPDCQEDPAYHHQYPGCPFTGQTPKAGRQPAPAPELSPAAKPGKKGKRKQPTAEPEESEDFSSLEGISRGKVGKMTGRRDLDTMEFRPTDAKKGEFEYFPPYRPF